MLFAGAKLQRKKHVQCDLPLDNRILIQHNSFQAFQTGLCYPESEKIPLYPYQVIG